MKTDALKTHRRDQFIGIELCFTQSKHHFQKFRLQLCLVIERGFKVDRSLLTRLRMDQGTAGSAFCAAFSTDWSLRDSEQ
jgi:hypothetical protein